MKWGRVPLVAAFIAGALIISSALAQSAPVTNPLETRAKEVARAVSTGRPEDLKQLAETFGGYLPNIPMPARPHRIVGFWPLDQLHKRMPEGVRPASSGVRLSDRHITREPKAFTERMARADVFSGVVALANDGVPVFEAAHGESNKELHIENRLAKKFNLASMGKMFTAIAIAQLEGGELLYEDPLSKFLPGFPDADSAKKIRIKHLLSNTSGLPMGDARPPNSSPRTVDDFLAAIRSPRACSSSLAPAISTAIWVSWCSAK